MAKVIPRVVDQSVEESAFLWQLRDAAVSDPHYLLADLARLDAHVEAQLDGLRVGGGAGLGLASPGPPDRARPARPSPPECSPSRAETRRRIQPVIELGTATPEAARGLVSALGWLPHEQASTQIRALLAGQSPAGSAIGLAASAIHRRNPGPALPLAYRSEDPLLKAPSASCRRGTGTGETQAVLNGNLDAKDPTVRFWAAWSSTLLSGNREAVACLQGIAEAGGPFAERAAVMAIRRLPSREAKLWLKRRSATSPRCAWPPSPRGPLPTPRSSRC